MELKTTFSHYYPENSKGGQCAYFAEQLLNFGPVGDLIASKTAYVKKHGILFNDLNGHFEIGDVVLTNESSKYGHVFIVNDIIGNQLQATESNYNLDKKVHHTRLVPVSKRIIGVLRNCPLKVSLINPMLKQTICIIENKVDHRTVQSVLNQAAGYFDKVTNGEFKLEYQTIFIDADLHIIHQQSISGYDNTLIEVDAVDPEQIRTIASHHNPTVLFFDSKSLPVVPNHPLNHGDVSQIAITPNAQVEVLTETFVHELLHNWCATVHQADTVHQHSGIYDPRPEANFSDIILKLKPFWPLLGRAEEENTMAKIIREPNGTFRFVFGNMNIGINSPKLAAKIKESGEPIVNETTSTKEIGVINEGLTLNLK